MKEGEGRGWEGVHDLMHVTKTAVQELWSLSQALIVSLKRRRVST